MPEQINALTLQQMKAFTLSQSECFFYTNKIVYFSPSQLTHFSSEVQKTWPQQIQDGLKNMRDNNNTISPFVLRQMTPVQIQSLTFDQIKNCSYMLGALEEKVRYLSYEQILHLQPGNISLLDDYQKNLIATKLAESPQHIKRLNNTQLLILAPVFLSS